MRLRLNRVTRASEQGTEMVLNLLRICIRVVRVLVVDAVVRLSPRVLLTTVGKAV